MSPLPSPLPPLSTISPARDSSPVTGKIPGMCELRNKIAPWEAWIPRISRPGWSPPPARRWRWFASSFNYTAGCQGFCGWLWRKALQDREIRFIYSRARSFGRHNPEAGGFCLDLKLIIRGVSSGGRVPYSRPGQLSQSGRQYPTISHPGDPTDVPDRHPLRFFTIVVGFRTQASPVMLISDCRSTMPMEPHVNIA
jgi:hypothetical protein